MLPAGTSRGPAAGVRSWRDVRSISLLAALIVGGCASVSGKSDYDRDVSFNALRTFAWMDAVRDSSDADAGPDPFLQRRLRRAVERELLERGFVAESGGASVDFVVTAYVTEPSASYAARQSGRGFGPRVSFGVGFGFGYPWWYGYRYPRCCGVGYRYFGYPYWGFPSWGFPYWGYPFVGYPVGVWYPWVGMTWGGRARQRGFGRIPAGHPSRRRLGRSHRRDHLAWLGGGRHALRSGAGGDAAVHRRGDWQDHGDLPSGRLVSRREPGR